jgi:hypothetical protein
MPSPYATLTAVTPATGQIKASDITQQINAYASLPRGLLTTPNTLVANSAGSTATAGPGTDSGLNITIVVPANRLVRVGFDGFLNSTVTTDSIFAVLLKDGILAANTVLTCLTRPSMATGMIFEEIPAAGTHIYRVYFYRASGTGTVNVIGGSITSGVQPALYADDMGAA